jgi:hypothetical protein
LLHHHALCDTLLDPELCSHQSIWLNISTGNDKFKTQLSTETLTLVTINIEGFYGNQVYLQTLANRTDILLLQEHWLHIAKSVVSIMCYVWHPQRRICVVHILFFSFPLVVISDSNRSTYGYSYPN